MREVEPAVSVLMNPQDAADHPDGTFGGHRASPGLEFAGRQFKSA